MQVIIIKVGEANLIPIHPSLYFSVSSRQSTACQLDQPASFLRDGFFLRC